MISAERRVVITGLGAVTPIGLDVATFWQNLEKGKGGVRLIRNFDIPELNVKMAAEVDLPDNETIKENFHHKKMIKRLDRYIILGALAGAQAYRDSGIDGEAEGGRIGCIIASGEGGLATHYDQIPRLLTKGANNISPFYVTNVIPNSATAFVSQEFNLRGPSFSVSSACASSNHALGLSAALIKMGMADVFFAGGAEAVANPPSLAAFNMIGALSNRFDDPSTASRPFDKGRDGFVMGEGAGVLCVEELEHAKRRGAHIYAELTGFGFTSDAYDLVAPHPEGIGAAQAMADALSGAKLNTSDIGLINCHGTSTPVGDKAEYMAILKAFGHLASKVPVHSTKSMIGHLIGGTSAVEAVAAIMTYEKGIIHPTINQFEKDPEIDLNIVKEPTDGSRVKHILSNSFGFGGHNACVIISRFEG